MQNRINNSSNASRTFLPRISSAVFRKWSIAITIDGWTMWIKYKQLTFIELCCYTVVYINVVLLLCPRPSQTDMCNKKKAEKKTMTYINTVPPDKLRLVGVLGPRHLFLKPRGMIVAAQSTAGRQWHFLVYYDQTIVWGTLLNLMVRLQPWIKATKWKKKTPSDGLLYSCHEKNKKTLMPFTFMM